LGEVALVFDRDDGHDHLIVEGATGRWLGLGRGWHRGRLVVQGDVGAEAGAAANGGTIVIDGNAGDGAGAGMVQGTLIIQGRAGQLLGGPWGDRPMRGGLIVAGAAGPYTGFGMRRGLIAVNRAGRDTGLLMRAGTIVAKEVESVGRGVRRGSVIAQVVHEFPEFFVPAGIVASSYVHILQQALAPHGFDWIAGPNHPQRWVGDREELNKGELWLCQ
jgi:formylmethanofuran dehydrogenase subunit C